MSSNGHYTMLDLFPDCILPSCRDHDKVPAPHQHIYPKQQVILNSTSKYLYMQGGVGGGKTTAYAAKVVHLALSIPNNRGIVSRFHLDDLYDSSWRAVKECLVRLVERRKIPSPEYSKKVAGEFTSIVLHNGSELRAVHGKNFHRGLGASHGFFYVDDALECLEEFFVGDDTSAGLLSRLRLPHVHYDSATYSESTRRHGSLHGMVSSNPPPYGHWLHKLFGDKPGTHEIGGDTVEWIMGSTGDNPTVGEDYGDGIMAIQSKMGRSANVVKRVIFGHSIPAYGGVPVFPQFTHAKHVADLKFNPASPLIRSIDFGYHHPAAIFSQLMRCEHGTNHYLTLSEVHDCFDANVYTFWDKYVVPHTRELYGGASLVCNCGDRAGFRASSSNKDRRGDGQILQREYHLAFKWRYLDLDKSLQYIRGLLEPKHPCKCGMEYILISPKCPILIGALEGGYKYSKPRGKPVGDKPIEDKFFADIACAWRYGAENFVKWGVPREEVVHALDPPRRKAQASPYDWLEATDRQFAALALT